MKNNVIQQDGKYYEECEVVMLPSNKTVTRIGYNPDRLGTNRLYYSKEGAGNQSQHLYILSNEEIKKGDWFIYKEKYICKAIDYRDKSYLTDTGWCFKNDCKKIITTTDISLILNIIQSQNNIPDTIITLPRPSNEFIQKYVELQGKIDKVLVEIVDVSYPDLEGEIPQPKHYQLKVAPDNTITIRPIEIKKDIFSREEVRKILLDFAPFVKYDAEEGKWTNIIDNWIKENL